MSDDKLKTAEQTALQGMQALKEKAREKVQDAFADLFPDELLDELIQAEVRAFFETETQVTLTETGGQWSRSSSRIQLQQAMTPFRQLVWLKVRELVNIQILQWFDSDDFKILISETWNDEKQGFDKDVFLGAYFQEYLEKNVNKLVAALLTQPAGAILEQAKNELEERFKQHNEFKHNDYSGGP